MGVGRPPCWCTDDVVGSGNVEVLVNGSLVGVGGIDGLVVVSVGAMMLFDVCSSFCG